MTVDELNSTRDSDDPPTEVSRLLMPSPISTDRPSIGNLRSLMEEGSVPLLKKRGSEVSEIQLQSFSSLDQLTTFDVENGRAGKRKCSPFHFLAVAVATISVITLLLVRRAGIPVPSHPGGAGTGVGSWTFNEQPLSLMDPVQDMALASFKRPEEGSRPHEVLTYSSSGSINANNSVKAYPTNAWYQNLILVDGEPSQVHQTYTIPYVVDAAGPIPGLRFHPNHIGASSEVVQVYSVDEYGLTLGAYADASRDVSSSDDETFATHRYRVQKATNLGLTMQWEYFPMSTTLVKGTPYGTMIYDQIRNEGKHGEISLPTVSSQISLSSNPIIDGASPLRCDKGVSKAQDVEREVELFFGESDFTWLVFFSEPVKIQCVAAEGPGMMLQVVDRVESNEESSDEPLVVRIALYKACSSGSSSIYCHQEQMHPTALLLGQGEYGSIIRRHVRLYPGPDTKVHYAIDNQEGKIQMTFDWDAREMGSKLVAVNASEAPGDLITFALPHHLDTLQNTHVFGEQIYCTSSLMGPACLVEGSHWNLTENIPEIGLNAPRPPAPWAIHALAESVEHDLKFHLPSYYQLGAGDTYFSGKMLAKLGRIVLVAQELRDVCSDVQAKPEYSKDCEGISIPSNSDISNAANRLRSSVEVWLNGSSATPFVYDSSWGGVVNCGCDFNGKKCNNKFPNCPAFSDPGLNFGNGFYNDMHFHYGYHIYAAAVVAHFDPDWGRRYFERVLLLIRNIANPSEMDEFFPTWRHKDWYQGHSWASGIAFAYLNGRNQESSSEAIAAYEAIALYGDVMSRIYGESSAGAERIVGREALVASQVRGIGQVLTATELRAAQTYWHVSHSPDKAMKIYPSGYTPKVVGIIWQQMAQFQTWFGKASYLMYGIQQLPLTPVSELRDDMEWAMEAYPDFAESCENDPGCTGTGWSILQMSMLATVGHGPTALERVLAMPDGHFNDAAGDGHSLSNTIWYIATRPKQDQPLPMPQNGTSRSGSSSSHVLTDCGRPDSCTDFVLDTIAGLYSCRQRIQWLINQMGQTEEEACSRIAGVENPSECGLCNPNGTKVDVKKIEHEQQLTCPACTAEECASDLNRCPRYQRTFVCTSGSNSGGCSGSAWTVQGEQCSKCCELTSCPRIDAIQAEIAPSEDLGGDESDSNCPTCSPDISHSRLNQCPPHGAPFLCYEGRSKGGCSPRPWVVTEDGGQCSKCCRVER